MTKVRLNYIDIAKGILILLVIIDHIPDVYLLHDASNANMLLLNEWQWVYKCFYMPAFFIITGYCSNFNKDFNPFLISNIKTILIPSMVIGAIVYCFNCNFNADNVADTIIHILITCVRFGGFYWFLGALFLSKLFYWFLNKKLKNDILIACILIILTGGGLLLNKLNGRYDVWYLRYALVLNIFIFIGDISKRIDLFNNKWVLIGCSSAFVVTIFAIGLFLPSYDVPIVTMKITVSLIELPLVLFLSITGTMTVVLISQLIAHCSVLEFFGKHSIEFYLLQIPTIVYSEKAFNHFIQPNTLVLSIMYLLIDLVVVSCILTLLSYLLNTKWLKWSLGK